MIYSRVNVDTRYAHFKSLDGCAKSAQGPLCLSNNLSGNIIVCICLLCRDVDIHEKTTV